MTSPSRRRAIAVILVFGLAAAACAGDTGNGPTTSPIGPATPTSPSTESPEIESTPADDGGTLQNVIAWILGLGPSAPSGPTGFDVYDLLGRRECDAVFDRVEELDDTPQILYRGAASACLAAFEGRDDLWDEAEAALERVANRPDDLNCLDVVVLELLESLVEAHRDNPRGRFEARTDPSAGRPAPCPSIDRVRPERGPPDTEVRVTGANLERVDAVDIRYDNGGRDQNVTFTRRDGSLELVVPGRAGARSACIALVVERPSLWFADGVVFTLEESATSPPTAGPSPTPTATTNSMAAAGALPCPPKSES